jgi:hypothetical protein
MGAYAFNFHQIEKISMKDYILQQMREMAKA